MTCADVKELLPRHQHGRLAADDAAIVDRHVAGCAACAAEHEAGDRVDRVLTAAFSDHPFDDPAALVARVRAAANAGPRRHLERRRPAGLWTAAAAVGLLALGLGLLRSADEKPTPGSGPAPARAVVARASGQGKSLQRVSTGERAEALPTDATVREGDHLVAVGGEAQLQLDDGTKIEVAPDTEVALRRDADGGSTLVIEGQDGEVYCEVSKRERPLRVLAGGLEVAVLGTRFVVHKGTRGSRVMVLEGRVVATSASDRRILGADEGVEARESEPLFTRLKLESPDLARWVPRLRDELARRFPVDAPAAPTQPSPPPLPTLPAPPIDPGLDTPVTPPTSEPEPPGQH